MKKLISPVAINSLKEALTNIYWYKKELRSFITHTISTPQILAQLNWGDYKRNVVTRLIDYLATDQDKYQDDLLNLISAVSAINDFSHLKRLEGGLEKATTADDSVRALRKVAQEHFDLIEKQKKVAERKRVVQENILRNKGIAEKLEEIQKEYLLLVSDDNKQSRGFKLEKVIKNLFELFDLDPKASFRIKGEQIDGAFTFDNTDYLFEAKWQQKPVDGKDLAWFSDKVRAKLDNTLGLCLSIGGFSDTAVQRCSSGTGGSSIFLMDGADLMAVIEGRIDFKQLLLRKRKHAAQTGQIFLPIHAIL